MTRPELGREAQEIGAEAENRVINIAKELGLDVETSPTLDYSRKTDLTINGIPIQVSVNPKSKRTRKCLERRGVKSIVAGKQISDEQIVRDITIYLND